MYDDVHSGMCLAASQHTFEQGLPTWRSRSEGLLAVGLAAIRAVPSRRSCCNSSVLSVCAPSVRSRLHLCHHGMLCAAWNASEVVRLGEATSTSEMLHPKDTACQTTLVLAAQVLLLQSQSAQQMRFLHRR